MYDLPQAFGSTEAMSDRVCIHSGGNIQVNISAEDLLDCCIPCGAGCSGGYPGAAWEYWKERGLVSGGLYGTPDGCKPYSLAPCEHHIKGSLPNCTRTVPTPSEKVYSIARDEKQIQTEIFKNGPVQADFTVFADFLSYKSGVYQHHSGHLVENHAIRILGWGTQNGAPYWLAANSWNQDWATRVLLLPRRPCSPSHVT
ncbi:hypothetical protein HPB47_019537 [Ixodes persulcatus]|uniref:Uncharacterized protein n=1 Tax=Ixodes persulcatus TaxID=34615 RepID=A0AC60QIT4_IXOPE|nr:hypothetical protein HPB47_019537 [Ixodes persulcatus]